MKLKNFLIVLLTFFVVLDIVLAGYYVYSRHSTKGNTTQQETQIDSASYDQVSEDKDESRIKEASVTIAPKNTETPTPSPTPSVSYEITEYFSHYDDMIGDWSLAQTGEISIPCLDSIWTNKGFSLGTNTDNTLLFVNTESSPVTLYGFDLGSEYSDMIPVLSSNGWTLLEGGTSTYTQATAPDGSTVTLKQYMLRGTFQSTDDSILVITTDSSDSVLYWYITNNDMMAQDWYVDYNFPGYHIDWDR